MASYFRTNFQARFLPQDEIIRPGMTFRPPDVLALIVDMRAVRHIILELCVCVARYMASYFYFGWCMKECALEVYMN